MRLLIKKSAPFVLFGKTDSRDDFFPRKPEAFVLTYFFAQVSPERQTDRGRIRVRETIEGYCRFLGWEESEPTA